MAAVELQVTDNGTARIEVSAACLADTLEQVLSPIPKLLMALMDAEVLLSDFPETLQMNRQRAAMAVAMKATYHLEQAQRLFQGVTDLASGTTDAAAFGFSEFLDDAEVESFTE